MKAVILLAGFGSRLRPLTEKTHKALLPLGEDSTTLKRMISLLQEYGVTEFVAVTGYKSRQVRSYIRKNFPNEKFSYVYNKNFTITNTGYSLLLAKRFVIGEEFVKLDGDVSFDPEIAKRLLDKKIIRSAICLDNCKVDDEVIKASLNEHGLVSALGKYVPVSQAVGESIGIERIAAKDSAPLFQRLKELMKDEKNWQEYYEYAYDQLIREGVLNMSVIDITGLHWTEMDNLEDYRQAQNYFGR